MTFGTLKFSGASAFASAAFHALLAVVTGVYGLWLVAALIWLALGFGLWREVRWLAWPSFLIAAFGVAIGISGIFGPHAWAYWLIVIADLVTALSLFWNIWKRP